MGDGAQAADHVLEGLMGADGLDGALDGVEGGAVEATRAVGVLGVPSGIRIAERGVDPLVIGAAVLVDLALEVGRGEAGRLAGDDDLGRRGPAGRGDRAGEEKQGQNELDIQFAAHLRLF